jgi:acetate kinase
MTPLILVANVRSSSLKFALFKRNEADQPVAEAAGEVEGIGTQPRFTVKNAAGQTLVDRTHDVDEVLRHSGAIAVIRSWLHEHDQGAKLPPPKQTIDCSGTSWDKSARW